MVVRAWRGGIFVSLLCLFSVATAYAQGECASLLRKAVDAIENNCAELGRNNACYGYNLVEAGFLEEQPDDFFALPSDRSPLADLSVIRTASLDLENDQWGIAIMSVQANIPNSLPGQSVTFVLLGDTELENAVEPEESFVPAEPISVTITENARVRSGPGTNFNIIGIAEAGTTLETDARSDDGQWLRVAFENRPLWMSLSLVQADTALDTLPAFNGTQRSPMQAFYLRNGIGAADCEEADNALVVQGPKNINIDLTVNGANLSIGSTVVLTAVGDELVVTVIDGEVTIDENQDGEIEQTLVTGQQSTVCLGAPQDLGIDGESNDKVVSCAFSDPIDIPFEELGEDFCNLEGIPLNVLSYPVNLLCEGESREEYLQDVLPRSSNPTNQQQTTQQRGNCAGLALISPLGSIPIGQTTFSWSPAASVDQYFVNFYGVDGANTYSTQVGSDINSISVDTMSIPQGDRLQWEVLGAKSGQIICNTGRSTLLNRADVVISAPVEGFGGDWSCTANSLTLPWSWKNAPSGSTVTLYWQLDGTNQAQGSGTGESGSGVQNHTGNLSTISGFLRAEPSGFIFTLRTLTNCGDY